MFAVVYGAAQRDGPLVNVVAKKVQAFGPEVLRGASPEEVLRVRATTPTGRGPTTPIGQPPVQCELDLVHRSHDFR